MKTVIETDAQHITEEIERAGFSKTARLRFTVEPSRPRKSGREIAEQARREAPLRGMSEELLGYVREFRENFTLDPDRRHNR